MNVAIVGEGGEIFELGGLSQWQRSMLSQCFGAHLERIVEQFVCL